MCGIVGYVGSEQAGPILLDGLSKLEYRGYDSAGIAVRNDETGEFQIVKAKGRLHELYIKTDGGRTTKGTCGIGHTRWATHGEATEINAHPHYSDDKNVVGVHNGIIENYQELKEKLTRKGYSFYSETDTEVVIKLIDYYYKKYLGTPVDAINHTLVRIRGAYSLAVMFKEYPGEIYVARKDAPLVVGRADGASLCGSDVSPMLKFTRTVYYIDDLQLGKLTKDGVTFYNLDGDEIEIEPKTVNWDAEAVEKCGFEHFMMKEIHEQPKAITETLNAYIKDGVFDLSAAGIEDDKLKTYQRIYIVACGSAYHVGVAAKYVFEKMAQVPVEIDIASEFRYRDPILMKDSLFVVISQSGETADSLAALRLVKEKGIDTLAVVNVTGSSIAREADYVMYTYAGPEIAVATTKAYSCQLINMYLLSMAFARAKGLTSADELDKLIKALYALPGQINEIISDKERIQWFASQFSTSQDIFFIGRGIDYAIGLEGSLKTKEISYIHSEAYAAGELKHGTISLIDKGTLVISIATQDALYEKTVSNIVEVKSRGAYLMGITNSGNYNIENTVDFVVYVPRTEQYFTTSLAIVPLQLLAYYISLARGLDVDKPRNLAKSVTVE